MATPTASALPQTDVDAWALKEARRLLKQELTGTGVRAWLFGSRARGDHRPFSDVDIALQAPKGAVPAQHLAALRAAFEESRIPYRVDLVDLARADEALAKEVRAEGLPWSV